MVTAKETEGEKRNCSMIISILALSNFDQITVLVKFFYLLIYHANKIWYGSKFKLLYFEVIRKISLQISFDSQVFLWITSNESYQKSIGKKYLPRYPKRIYLARRGAHRRASNEIM